MKDPIRPDMPDVSSPLIERALNQFKVEVAGDLGLPARPRAGAYLGYMSARDAGHLGGPIGGEMVRRMIERAEKDMAGKKSRE